MGLGWRHFKLLWFHGIPWNIPWNSMELSHREIKCHQVSWNLLGGRNSKWHQSSMELRGSMRSPNQISKSSMEFHGTWGVPFQMKPGFHGIPWNIPWNSMELYRCQIRCHIGRANSMEIWDYQSNWHQVPMNLFFIFHGTHALPKNMSQSLMELHGIWWLWI